MSRWPIQSGPFRPLSRTERANRILKEALGRFVVDEALKDIEVELAIRVKDSSLGLPDDDRDLAALVASQMVEAFSRVLDDLSGCAVPA